MILPADMHNLFVRLGGCFSNLGVYYALFRCPETSQTSDTLVNFAMVDAHGVIFSCQYCCIMYAVSVHADALNMHPYFNMWYVSHIGVGSNIVRSLCVGQCEGLWTRSGQWRNRAFLLTDTT